MQIHANIAVQCRFIYSVLEKAMQNFKFSISLETRAHKNICSGGMAMQLVCFCYHVDMHAHVDTQVI